MHCSGVILAHSSTQTVFKSWRFHGLLLWTLIFSSFLRFSIGFKSGDWLGHSSSFIFFLWKPIESFLGCVFGIIVLLKCPPSFHLHHPGRWHQIFYLEWLFTFFHSSFLQLYEVCPVPYSPTPWCSHLQAPLLVWCFGGDVQCHLTSKHGVYYGIQRVNFGLIWPDYILPVISQACLNAVQQTLKELQHCFFLQQWSLAGWACIQATAVEGITYCFLWNNCTC